MLDRQIHSNARLQITPLVQIGDLKSLETLLRSRTDHLPSSNPAAFA